MTTPLEPVDLTNLKGRSVLFTGAASVIGLETAQLFASNGAYVTVADVQPPLEDLAKQQQHHHVQYVHCDVSEWTSQVTAFKKAIDFSPPKTLDAVATFAAVDLMENLIDQIKADENVSLTVDPAPPSLRTVDINLKGTYYSATLALHYFRFQPANPASSPSPPTKSLIFISTSSRPWRGWGFK